MNIIEKKSIKGHKKKPRKTMIFPLCTNGQAANR